MKPKLIVLSVLLVVSGCEHHSRNDAFNTGVVVGASHAVSALMERMLNNGSLTIRLTSADIEQIRQEAIKAGQITK